MAIVEAQLQHGLLLDQTKIPKAGDESFLLVARELRFAQPECWKWLLDSSYPMVQVAEMLQAPALDVFGKKTCPCPNPAIMGYKFALKVKLTEKAFGWEFPVTLKMKTPDRKMQDHEVYLNSINIARETWFDLDFGVYYPHEIGGVIEFFVLEIEGPMKGGLVIAGVVFSPIPPPNQL